MTANIVRIADLHAAGSSVTEARAAVRALTRVAPGTYVAARDRSPEQLHRIRAEVVLSRVTGVVASHVTAAVLQQLPVMRADLELVHLSAIEGRPGGAKRGAGHLVHCAPVLPGDVEKHQDLSTTNAARTVIDCARRFDVDRGVMAADAALHRGLTTPEELTSAAHAARRRRGARRGLAVVELASPLAESPGESLLRLRLLQMGLQPREQVAIADVPGNPRVDFLMEDRLVIEFDGESKYELDGDPARAHWEEKLRHDRLVEAGYEVLRIVWADLWDLEALAARIRRAIDRARRRTHILP